MKAEELWSKFCNEKGIDVNTPYESWQFGGIQTNWLILW